MNMIEHRVRERAYYIWEGEGRIHGRADAHWLQAEAEFAAVSADVAPAAAVSVAQVSVAQVSVAEVTVAKAAKAPVARAKAPAKAAAPKAAASKAAAAKAPAKPKKAPRVTEVGIALH